MVPGAVFDRHDRAVIAGFVLVGCALTFTGLAGGLAAFLCGPLVASAGCFWHLHRKDVESAAA